MKFEMYKQEKNLIIGLLVCALVVVIGYSFAYFTSGTILTGDGASTKASTAKLPVVEYKAGNKGLVFEGAYPGKSSSKEFTVSYTGTGSEKIAIKLKIGENANGFTYCTSSELGDGKTCDTTDKSPQLVIKLLKGGETISDGEINLTDITNQEILLAEDTISSTTNYNVVVEFKETGHDQSHNIGKQFEGSIEVVFADI